MVPVVSFIGRPDSGKSTLIEKLLPELQLRGFCAGVIKHTSHDVPLDTPGKDTARFTAAGAPAAALVTPRGLALFRPAAGAQDLETVAEEYFTSFDIVLAEGFKEQDRPKIEVLAAGAAPNPAILGKIALVADGPVASALPVFSHADITALADFLEKEFISKGSRSEVKLWVNGEFIPLKPFVKAFVGQTVKGMVNALKGARQPEKIRIKIGR